MSIPEFPGQGNRVKEYVQGNRTSNQRDEPGQIGVVPAGPLELPPSGPLGCVLLQDVESHVPKHRHVLGPMTETCPALILVHHDIEAQVQAVLNPPV